MRLWFFITACAAALATADRGSLPGPAPGPAEVAAPTAALAPLAEPSSQPDVLRVLVKFLDSTISVNSTGNEDFQNVPEPQLPGLAAVGFAHYLGILIYESTVGLRMQDAAAVCGTLTAQYSNIQFCEPDAQVTLDQTGKATTSATPDDPLYSTQWDVTAIGVPTVWQGNNFGSAGVRVCMIDSRDRFPSFCSRLLASVWPSPCSILCVQVVWT